MVPIQGTIFNKNAEDLNILNVEVLLTVHLSIILVTDQLNAQILVL